MEWKAGFDIRIEGALLFIGSVVARRQIQIRVALGSQVASDRLEISAMRRVAVSRWASVVLGTALLIFLAGCSGSTSTATPASTARAPQAQSAAPSYAVGPQYDTTHVYVEHGTLDQFVASWQATFGGTTTTQSVVDVTPTPSSTKSQLVLSSVGTLSVFDFETPVPYPFGMERTGLLVSNFDRGVQAARGAGMHAIVAPFPDPIGRDAVVQFPGGINTQLYWHTTPPAYPPLATVPDNRLYLSQDGISSFLASYLQFTGGTVVNDTKNADAAEIGEPGQQIRRIQIESPFGNALVFVTDGHLPYPFGREVTGYSVMALTSTLAKAKAAGASVLWGPVSVASRTSALVQFPGGYIAEIHSASK
jgi:hypothetical protein